MIGAIADHIPKKLAALISTEFRPVASICAKYIITLDIIKQRFTQTAEDYELQDDAQEGFRRDRSTHRQLNKLGSAPPAARPARTWPCKTYRREYVYIISIMEIHQLATQSRSGSCHSTYEEVQ
jgi:hypothetical protein